MLECFSVKQNQESIPIQLVSYQNYSKWLLDQSEFIQNWLNTCSFKAEPSRFALIPNVSGKIEKVICCITGDNSFWDVGHLAFALPEGNYHFQNENLNYELFALSYGLGSYQFNRYKKTSKHPAKLFLSEKLNHNKIVNLIEAIYLVRDLINTPTENMGPTELAEVAAQLSQECNATFKQWVGKELLDHNFPAIHAVGRASDDEPRLVELTWGDKNHPKVTLIGKGVCFDSGGLDIKNSSNMSLMKKDMGGAAHVLGLAKLIIKENLKINLRVLIPIVENSISGNAYRPGDIIQSRKGLSIEIGNTDAEGRLILADALSEAVTQKPDLIIDIATLTGAARVALGTELPAFFSNNDQIADDLIKESRQSQDYIWRLPLFQPYRDSLNTPFADINNCGSDSYGGAITAALFLQEFIDNDIPWVHFDLMAWNLKSKPGRPVGGEAMGFRALFSYLVTKFS